MGSAVSCRRSESIRPVEYELHTISQHLNGEEIGKHSNPLYIRVVVERNKAIITRFEGDFSDMSRRLFKDKLIEYLMTREEQRGYFDLYSGEWMDIEQPWKEPRIANGGKISYLDVTEDILPNLVLLSEAVLLEVKTDQMRREALATTFFS